MKKAAILLAVVLVLGGVGFWLSTMIEKVEPTEDQSTQRSENLEALPYMASVADEDPREGLVQHLDGRAQPGLTLATIEARQETVLIDLAGEIVHRWSRGPGAYAAVGPDGSLVCEQGFHGLTKFDWDGNEVWRVPIRSHHEVFINDEGTVWSLDGDRIVYEGPDGKVPILNDYIVRVSSDGKIEQRISVMAVAGSRIPLSRFDAIGEEMVKVTSRAHPSANIEIGSDTPYDVFHTNSVVPIPRTIEGVAEAGDLLVSIRELHLVAVVRPEPVDPADPARPVGGEIVWAFEGELLYQHHATLLDNDHFLVFDNGRGRDYSRVVEIDPKTQTIVWEFSGVPEKTMYTGWRGGAQRLPNGNTLVAESDKGRMIEVTPDKTIVWEYWMPKQSADKRDPVYRGIRLTGDHAERLRARMASP